MITIFESKYPDEMICPVHHIKLTYKHENNELVLKCDWCDYTLVPLTTERKEKLGLCKTVPKFSWRWWKK